MTALLVFMAVLGAKAQNINGKVVDETNQSVPFANVVQMSQDSAFLSGCVTDENGAFSMEKAQNAALLKVSFIGYKDQWDSVYGEGSKDKFFNEDDRTNPVNLYGKHKALAEQITITHGGNVVRFPFIIGHSLVKHKKHFFDNILSDLREGKTVEMFEDSYRSTLDFNNCAKLLLKIIEKFGSCEEKIINIAGDKAMSKYDVAIAMCEKYNLDKSLVKPVSVKSFTGIFKEKRAENGVLNNSKLKKLLNIEKIELEFED